MFHFFYFGSNGLIGVSSQTASKHLFPTQSVTCKSRLRITVVNTRKPIQNARILPCDVTARITETLKMKSTEPEMMLAPIPIWVVVTTLRRTWLVVALSEDSHEY